MTDSNVARQRLHNQRLSGAVCEKPEDVVSWLGAVQSQDYHGAKWAVAQRGAAISDAELDRLFDDGAILRTHILRPTWHFVTPADIRWMLALTAPRVNAVNAHYYRKLELDDAVFRRSNAAIAKALRGGKQLTRAELAAVLEGVGLRASGVRLAYLVMRAELDALICSGARRGKQFTYALLEERVPQAETPGRDESLAELTRRYFTSHGPALLQDYTWWSGLTMADAKKGIELAAAHLAHDTSGGKIYWFGAHTDATPKSAPIVHLLPNYDEYLVAYKDHSPTYDASLVKQAGLTTSALGGHIIVLNGQVVGGWRRTINGGAVTIRSQLFVTLGGDEAKALSAAAASHSRFLGKPVTMA